MTTSNCSNAHIAIIGLIMSLFQARLSHQYVWVRQEYSSAQTAKNSTSSTSTTSVQTPRCQHMGTTGDLNRRKKHCVSGWPPDNFGCPGHFISCNRNIPQRSYCPYSIRNWDFMDNCLCCLSLLESNP